MTQPEAVQPPDWDRLLEAVETAVREAGRAILDVYASDFTVRRKDDASPVTEADVRSERIIVAALTRLTPAIPVISEEAFCDKQSADVAAGKFWLVDPLDGTKEFVKKNGEFAINVGLIWNGQPTLGIIYGPVADRLFAARPGRAFVREADGTSHPIHCRPIPSSGLTVLTSRSHRSPDLFDAFVAPFEVAEIVRLGSSLKMGVIAAGEADLYPRFGRTMEWDTAAGHAILNAAGGRLTLPDESPLTYGKPGLENPAFVAWGRVKANRRP